MNNNIGIIGLAVVNGMIIGGKFGSNTYDVCGLMNLSLPSLDAMYTNLSNLKEKMGGKSLLNRNKASEINQIQEQMDLIEAIVLIKQEKEAELVLAKKIFKDRVNKLVLLSKAKEAKEIEKINNLSIEELEKQIAELE